MSFKSTDVRSYITNVRLNTFDQNTEEARVIFQDVHDTDTHALRVSVANPVTISGTVDVSGTFTTTIAPGTLVGITGSVEIGNFPATQPVSGSVSVSNFPSLQPITVSGVTIDASRLATYDASLNARFANLSYTGTLLNTYDSSVETQLTTANTTLGTISTDISNGIISKGVDDTGVAYPMYTDANGIQRVEVIPGHTETAKYVFETDATVIASPSANWSIDARGRNGWYYSSSATSTLTWYSNAISVPVPLLDFNKLQALYMVLTLDSTLYYPKMRVTTFYSVWDYTLPSAFNIYNGESYLFYYGNKAIALHPDKHPLEMTRTLISGPGGATEAVTNIQIISSGFGTGSAMFLLELSGLWNQDIQQRFEVTYDNVRDFTAETNLTKLNFSGTSLLTNVTNTVSVLDATVAGTLSTMSNRQVITLQGFRGNVASSITIAGWADTTSGLLYFNTLNRYGIDCVWSYNDTTSSATGDIALLGSLNGTTWDLIGLITPIVSYDSSGVANGRWGTSRVNIAPFTYIAIRNMDSISLTGVISSIYAGKSAGTA